jgi:RNA recognition motif-containing protein
MQLLTVFLGWSRLFVGDLSNDVSDDVLANAFNKYPSFQKAKVIRDRLSQKAKFGFVAFSDPEDFLKAWKDMDGMFPSARHRLHHRLTNRP